MTEIPLSLHGGDWILCDDYDPQSGGMKGA